MIHRILRMLIPAPCPVCGRGLGYFEDVCPVCKPKIAYIDNSKFCMYCLGDTFVNANICGKCLSSPPPYLRLYAACSYETEVKRMLTAYKFHRKTAYYASFARMITHVLTENNATTFDCVVPIPLYKSRKRVRGFNQSAAIARDVALSLDVPYNGKLLKKTRKTQQQSRLNYDLRVKNIRGAFSLTNPNEVFSKHILLIDDIFTTGATLREAARLLTKAGATVTVAVVARVPKTNS